MSKITLYVVTHKKIERKILERTVIGVGENKNIEGADLYDNTGDNISEKNVFYCELTALYWIWKNDSSDIVGLEHYRRQFLYGDYILNKKVVDMLLTDCDILVPHKVNLVQSIYHNYVKQHDEKELLEVEDIIQHKYPEYIEAFKRLKKTNKIYICNMFIAKRKFVDNFCKWLFDILFELEKRVDLSNKSDYQKRMLGFMAERLFNVYLYKHEQDLKIKSLSISKPINEENFPCTFSVKREVKYIIKRIINYEKMYR